MPTVDIYSTPTCGFCKMLKSFLSERNIPFTDHDVTVTEEARDEMMGLSGGSMSVPVIVFDKGKESQAVQIGYDEGEVSAALGL